MAVDMRGASEFRYLPQLDGVRALAVAVVVAAHAQLSVARGGGIGVDVFFVLSGYLITTLLLQEFSTTGAISLRHFYARRARRLLPALLLVAVFSLVAFSVIRPFPTDETLLGVVTSVLYVSCWFRAFHVSNLGWFGHSWSLSVEEHFYLFWPLALRAILRRRIEHVRAWVLAILAVAVAYRVVSTVAGVSGARTEGPDMRASQLLIGCALAVLLMGGRSDRAGRWNRWWRALVVVSVVDLARMVVFPDALGLWWTRYVAPEALALEASAVIGYLVVQPRAGLSRLLSHRGLVWLGRRSYAIYLWHLPLFGLLSLRGEPTAYRLAGRAAATVLTVVASAASFKWVESRFYRRRVEEPHTTDEGAPTSEVPTEREAIAGAGGRPG